MTLNTYYFIRKNVMAKNVKKETVIKNIPEVKDTVVEVKQIELVTDDNVTATVVNKAENELTWRDIELSAALAVLGLRIKDVK